MVVKLIGLVGGFPAAKEVYWYSSGSDQCHHHFMILVESIVERVKNQRKHGVWIVIGQSCSLLSGQAFIQGLEESADLVCITPVLGRTMTALPKFRGGRVADSSSSSS